MTERHRFAIQLAEEAGGILREGYHQQKHVRYKGDRDLVTEFDLRSESLITNQIQQKYPEDGILAEEGSDKMGGEGRWVIDPLDGTTNFAHGIPFFAVSIAYETGGEPLLGVIYDPLREECFHANAGEGAWLGDHPIHVSKTSTLEGSLLGTGFAHDLEPHSQRLLKQYALATTQAQAVRRLGSAALHMAYIANGRLDGYWEVGLSPWDWAAGILLVREAGGRISRVDGSEGILRSPASMLATNGHIHDDLVHLFKTIG